MHLIGCVCFKSSDFGSKYEIPVIFGYSFRNYKTIRISPLMTTNVLIKIEILGTILFRQHFYVYGLIWFNHYITSW